MKVNPDSLVPNLSGKDSVYMQDLYGRLGVTEPIDHQKVLDASESAWEAANDVGSRVEAVEALMGRRVDGQEIHDLPFELVAAVFEGEPFDVVVGGVQRALEWEQHKS